MRDLKKISIILGGIIVIEIIWIFSIYLEKDREAYQIPEKVPAILKEISDNSSNLNSFSGVNIVSSSTVKLGPTQEFVSEADNFKFFRLTTWNEIDSNLVQKPDHFDNLSFALKKSGTQCVLGLGRISQSVSDYVQTSFTNRILSPYQGQIDGSWYLEKSRLPKDFQFFWLGKQPFAHEMAFFSYYPILPDLERKNRYIILFDEDGKVVSEDCTRDVEAMLTTLTEYIERTIITPQSEGSLFIGTPTNRRILFIDKNIPDKFREVMKLKYDTLNPAVYKDLIYFEQDSKLKTLDIFTGSIKEIPLMGEGIVSFYIYKDSIFYIVGNERCHEYLARCDNLKILQYDMFTQKNTLIASDMKTRDIAGYDPIEKELYVYWADGDAGCTWSRTETFDLASGTSTSMNLYSWCDGDPNSTEMSKSLHDFLTRFSNSTTTYSLSIANSRISLPHDQSEIMSMKRIEYFIN